MNYTVYADNQLIFNRNVIDEHGRQLYPMLSPVLEETTEAFCSLTYRCKFGSPAYDHSSELVSRIKVYEDASLYWSGRIIKVTPTINAEKEVYVEDFLGVLCDTIYRPYDFYGTPSDFLQSIVDAHNSQASQGQKFYNVVCDVTGNYESNENIVRSSERYDTCWVVIKEKLLDMLGGYMWVSYDNYENPVLHYSSSPRNLATQKIKFRENLLNYRATYNYDGFYTALVPLGYKDYETKKYLTIESVNDGVDYLIDTVAAEKYGVIFAPPDDVTWDDVHDPAILKSKALTWLQSKSARLVKEIELSAHDLSGLNVNTRSFKWLDGVFVDAPEINDTFVIKHLSRPLDAPLRITISMGDARTSLTGSSVERQSESITRIEKIEADYVTGEDVMNAIENSNNSLQEELLTQITSIKQEATRIVLESLEEYVRTDDYETFQQTVRSRFEQLSNSILLRVSEEIAESIRDYNDGSVYNQFQEIYAFIRVVASGVVIGTSNTEVKMKLVGDTLFFFTGNEENVSVDNAIAYLKSDQLVVENSRIVHLSIGQPGAYMYWSVIGAGSTKCLFMSPVEV